MANVTLHDVARAAGVSHTTVSWALRGDARIKASTREKVEAIARELGYVPNEVARNLARGRTHTLAIVSSSFSPAFEAETLRGIETEISEAHPNFTLVQYSTGGQPERAQALYTQLLRGNRADAVIGLTDPPDEPTYAAYRQAGKPLVVFDEDAPETALAIRSDSRLGARLATGLLLDAGCRRPGIVISRAHENGRLKCNPGRLEIFFGLCAERGIEGRQHSIARFSFEQGKALARPLVEEGWDGVFCAAGDMVAIGIMAGCRTLGVKIPEALRIVGYDNLAIAEMVHPALSTIAQPLEEMGREAVRLCFSQMESAGAVFSPRSFPPALVRRESA